MANDGFVRRNTRQSRLKLKRPYWGNAGIAGVKYRKVPRKGSTVGMVLCICASLFFICKLAAYTLDAIRSANTENMLRDVFQLTVPVESALPRVTQTFAISPLATAASPGAVERLLAFPTDTPVPAHHTQYPNNPNFAILPQFQLLLQQNPEIVGWLTIDGLIDAPVVQRDNEFYLDHDALKHPSESGALFLDENCVLRNIPAQLLIHGHNMKSGAMFGVLKKYQLQKASFYRQHAYIAFSSLYEAAEYVIIAVLEADIRSEEPAYFNYISGLDQTDMEGVSSYIAKAKSLSMIDCPITVGEGDRLLALATCLNTADDKRLILIARMIQPNEDRFALNIKVMSTQDRQ